VDSAATPQLPLTLSTSRWAELAVTAFFGACAVALVNAGLDQRTDWIAFAGAAVIVVISVASLVVHPRLDVTATTVTDVGLFASTTYELHSCGPFHASRRGWGDARWRWFIVFDYGDGRARARGQTHRRRWKPTSCIEVHGHDGEQVARLLNQVRDRARHT
jgi:hypothetical protein